MFKLTQPQLERLGQVRQAQFEVETVERLEKLFPAQARQAGRGGVQALVGAALVRAMAFGVTGRRAAFKFIALSFVAGLGFDEDKAVRVVLEDPGLAPDEKVDVLFTALKTTDKGGV